jgi:hypothetical protein
MLSDGHAQFDGADATYGPARDTPFAGRVVVLLGLGGWGGGNGSRQFLAVMERLVYATRARARTSPAYRLVGVVQVGADYDRWFKIVELQGDRVVLRGRGWTKNDAHCCPSLDTSAVYRVTERGINEQVP